MKKPGSLCLKVVGFLLAVSCVAIYLNWEMVPKAISRVNFISIKRGNYIQIVPEADHGDLKELDLKAYDTQEKQFDLRIIVVVYNRAKSMLRLLTSLNDAEYYSDSVKLEVWIDRSVDDKVDATTFQTASEFKFKHGEFSVNPHPHHVGIYGQWLTTWQPKLNSSEIAVILEDDISVSPYFYKYLKLVHSKYDSHPEINGYALQGSTIKHSNRDTSQLQGPKGNLVFLYPVLGTWGFSPNRKNWMKFLDWFGVANNEKDFQPYVPGNIVTDWFKQFQKQGKASGVWSIWHIYYAWKNNEFTLYSNFEGHQGLATNWQEAGLHYQPSGGKATNKLLLEWKQEYENLPEELVCLDIAGKVIQK